MPKKGYKQIGEHRKKISKAQRGEKNSFFGKHISEEHKRQISKAQKGKKKPPRTEEHKRKLSEATKGKKKPSFSEEHRRKIGESQKGEKSHLWRGGIYTYERKLFLNNRRRARKLNVEGSHTQGEWELLKKQYGFKCPACKESEPKIKLTEDHIIPLSKGGSNYIENIQPLCRSCNSQKNTKIIKYE